MNSFVRFLLSGFLNPPLHVSTRPKTCTQQWDEQQQTNKHLKQQESIFVLFLSRRENTWWVGNRQHTHRQKLTQQHSKNESFRLTVFPALFWWLRFLCEPRIEPWCSFGVVTGGRRKRLEMKAKGQTEVRERLTEMIRGKDECKVTLMTCI